MGSSRYKDPNGSGIENRENYTEITETPCRCRFIDLLVQRTRENLSQRLLAESANSPSNLKNSLHFGYLITIPKPIYSPLLRNSSFLSLSVMEEVKSLQINGEETGDEFYEKIEAPKFVDFTVPDRHRPDDRYWFCLRVGSCTLKHFNYSFTLRSFQITLNKGSGLLRLICLAFASVFLRLT